MGGGLELAWLPLPRDGPGRGRPAEVKLGLLPGAGGARLPRVLGVEPALNMIVSGEAIKERNAGHGPGQKLFDKMAARPAESVLKRNCGGREKADVRPAAGA